jgi:hypothetical protein
MKCQSSQNGDTSMMKICSFHYLWTNVVRRYWRNTNCLKLVTNYYLWPKRHFRWPKVNVIDANIPTSVNKHKKSVKTTLYDPSDGSLTNQKPPCVHYMDWRTHACPNRLKMFCTSKTYLRAHKGSVESWVRSNRLSGASSPPYTWQPPIGPKRHFGVYTVLWCPEVGCHKPINRRGGAHLRTHNFDSLIFLLVSKARE